MIIERPKEEKKVNKTKKWILIYGRRKTGKSFLVENFVDYDEYFFVKRDRTVISKEGDKPISYETFMEVLKRVLKDNGVVVVDEFHRLGEDFFDFLHYTKKSGKLILISSTLFLSKNLFSSRSALLGFFAEMPLALISLKDCIQELKKTDLSKKNLLEFCVMFREPILIDYFDESESPRKLFAEILVASKKTVSALIGEIFVEEERHISAVYEGVLRAVANGNITSGEISSYLFSRRLLKKDDPSIIQQYLDNLVQFGILKKMGIYGKKRFVYKHVSPLAKLFYYADEKYNLSERKVSEKEVKGIINEVMPKLVEDSVRNFFAEKFGLRETIAQARDFEVDACLLKFKKPEIAIEVKWKNKVTKKDIAKAEENLQKIPAKRRILFVPDKKKVSSEVLEVLDATDL